MNLKWSSCRIIPVSLLLVTALSAFGQTRPDSMGWIQVKGNHFVNSAGKEMVFRGIAISDPDRLDKADHWNEEYFQKLREWGANVVRIPVHPDRFRQLGEKPYLKLLDNGVAWAKKNGLYIIIDWHVIGNLKTELMQDPSYNTTRKETFEFWRLLAGHYQNEPVVAFYEIFNEPSNEGDRLGDLSWDDWKPLAETLVKLVLGNNKRAIPLVSGLDWDYDLTPVASKPLDIPGIGYTVHPYPQKREKPWEEKWQADWGFVAEKYPVFATEFGFGRNAPMPCKGTEEYGNALVNFMEKRGISWTAWCFDTTWFPTLLKDWNFTPTEQGAFFQGALQKLNRK
jgi:endoglucanase